MEVGPLARMLVAYASGRADVKDAVDGALAALGVPVTALFSTLGRTAARGVETRLVAGWAREFYAQLLANIKNGDTRMADTSAVGAVARGRPTAQGVGMSEAPRGALAHWIVITDGKIDNYQLVVPSTWNASPRDGKGQRSAYEAALIGTPIAQPRSAARGPAHRALVRSVHRLRRAHLRRTRPLRAPARHVLAGRLKQAILMANGKWKMEEGADSGRRCNAGRHVSAAC